MPGTSIGSDQDVSRQDMVKKCIEVLRAGGTVYLGETHTEEHGRRICSDILTQNCVQYLCLEFDSSCQEFSTNLDFLDRVEAVLGHGPPVKMSEVIKALSDPLGNIVFVDKQVGTTMRTRQTHIAENIKECRKKITKPGRGVLVLIGSDHLKDINDRHGQWDALHEMVYSGLSFIYGKCKSCLMTWQLS